VKIIIVDVQVHTDSNILVLPPITDLSKSDSFMELTLDQNSGMEKAVRNSSVQNYDSINNEEAIW
jgi:hypothetical protein